MGIKEFDLDGGESVFCINERQLRMAGEMMERDDESSKRVSEMLERIETDLSRNERAALSFVLIRRLLDSPIRAGT